MRPHTLAEAQRVIDLVEEWQDRFTRALGRRLVYASDEYYLLAQRPFPVLDAYDGLPQQENGIGMARAFELEIDAAIAGDDTAGHDTGCETNRTGFFAWVDGAPAEGYRAPRLPSLPFGHGGGSHGGGTPVTIGSRPSSTPATTHIVTGELGARVLRPLLPTLKGVASDTDAVELLVVANRFFGGNIGVTGLLTGADVADALGSVGTHDRVLLPDVVLSNGVFLDGTSVDDLPRAVEIVPTDGASLVRALARPLAGLPS